MAEYMQYKTLRYANNYFSSPEGFSGVIEHFKPDP